MNNWWAIQNPENIHFVCAYNWTQYDMPFATQINGYYSDFGNGYVPFFGVIGQGRVVKYGDNGYTGAIDASEAAIAEFGHMTVLHPVANQAIFLNETVSLDVSDVFFQPEGLPVTVTVIENTNPDIVTTNMDGNTLILTAGSNVGNTQITIQGDDGAETITNSFSVTVVDPSERYILILDLDPTSAASNLQASIENFYEGPVYVDPDLSTHPPVGADAIFVLLGVYSNNHQLTDAEAAPMVDYLNNGGNIYMEGADAWAYDPQTALHDMFGINGTDDGTGDLSNVTGLDFLDGMSWSYSGENSYIDHLDANAGATPLFSAGPYNCGIAYESRGYKTVGTSFEITGLGGTNTLDDAVEGIMNFFDFGPVLETPLNVNIDVTTGNLN